MSKFWNFAGGLILGLLAGTAAGLLLAPKPGDELRKDMQQEIDDILSEARQASELRRKEMEAQFLRFHVDNDDMKK
jgi:gas vesicle protein